MALCNRAVEYNMATFSELSPAVHTLAGKGWQGRPGREGLAGKGWQGRPGREGLAGKGWQGRVSRD